jgi:hypothetical protein
MSDTFQWIKQRPTLTWVRFLGVIVIVSFALSGYTVVRQSQAAAARAADRKAANTSQVARCYQQVRDSPDVLRILGLLDTLAKNSILANRQALELDGDDPLRPIRKSSLRRLVPARKSLGKFIARSRRSVPTIESCDQMARALRVDPKPFRKTS